MRSLPTVLVLGTVVGLQVGLEAIGLVLIYRAGRYLNFAQGQIGSLAAASLGVMVLQAHLPYWSAVPLALAVGAVTGLGVERLLGWRLFRASRLALMIATIGVAQLLLILTLEPPFRINPDKLTFSGYPEPFRLHVHLGGAVLDASQVTTLIVAPLIAAGLFWLLGSTRIGVAIRGTASNPDAARLAGVSVRRMSTVVWVLAALVSSVAAVLYAPSQPVSTFGDAGIGLLLESLAAALLAGMADFRLALMGGLLVGLVDQAAVFYSHTSGLPDLMIAGVLVTGLVLRVRPLARSARAVDALVAESSTPDVAERIRGIFAVRRSGRIGWALLAAVLLILPAVPGLRTQERAVFLLLMVSYAMAGLGLTVLTGWAGQVSLGQFALLGVGAYAAAYADRHDLGLPAMVLLAGLVAAGVSVIVGLAAVRFRGVFLSAVTLAFAFVARDWLFRQSWVTGGPGSIVNVSHPRIFGLAIHTVRSAYLAGVVVLLLTVAALHSVRRSNVGRALIAVRDNPEMAASAGMTPTAVKVVALAVAGLVTGMGGALWSMAEGTWSFTSFDPTMSFVLLSCAIAGGIRALHGPVLGVLIVFAWPYLVPGADTLAVRSFTSGALLLGVLLFLPGGLDGLLSRLRGAAFSWLARQAPAWEFGPRPGSPPLEVQGVSVSFGGIRALMDVSIRVGPGEIVGLIGGNGAGKSTLLACISGHLQPEEGRIEVAGNPVVGLPPEFRADLGLRRTFQDARLFPGLTVTEALLTAVDRDSRSGTFGALLGAPWMRAGEMAKRERIRHVLADFGLSGYADTLTGELSTGTRRVCELAGLVAADASLVLLDEPTAGLAQREVEAAEPLLKSLRDVHGCSVLIVEHDVPLMLSICDRIYCLEDGRLIAEGAPEDVGSDPRVIASYLGVDAAAVHRSGRTGSDRNGAGRARGRTTTGQRPAKNGAARRPQTSGGRR